MRRSPHDGVPKIGDRRIAPFTSVVIQNSRVVDVHNGFGLGRAG
jgi:hypothetical protein